MKKIGLIVIIIILAFAAGYFLRNLLPSGGQPPAVKQATPTPKPDPGLLPSPTAAVKPPPATPTAASVPASPTPVRPATPIPGLTPLITPTPLPLPPPTPPPAANVKFDLNITDISGSGLTRTATTQLVNAGNADAHNVWAKVEVTSQNSKIKVSGQDYLREDIGILKAGETVTRQVTMSFGALDSIKILRSGARFVLTIYSDEKTETLYYDYTP